MKRVNDTGAFAPERDDDGRALPPEAVFDRRWMLLVTLVVLLGLACAIDAFLPRHVHGAHAAPLALQLASTPASTRELCGRCIVTKCIEPGMLQVAASAESTSVFQPLAGYADWLAPSGRCVEWHLELHNPLWINALCRIARPGAATGFISPPRWS